MTKAQLTLREEAIKAMYVDNDIDKCVNAQMELFHRMQLPYFFRYRPLNDLEMNSLEQETIYLRWPSTYEDNGDCRPVFDYEEITEYIRRKKYDFIDASLFHNKLLSYDDIRYNHKFMEKVDATRDMWLVSCFTESFSNSEMWKNYSDHGKGICLAYNSKELYSLIKEYSVLDAQFLPVRYVDDRESCKDMMLDHHDLLEDKTDIKNKLDMACMTKDRKQFSFEEEWRLLLHVDRKEIHKDKGVSAPFTNPQIIILGENADKKSGEYNRLIDLARKKDIQVVEYCELICEE